jgi:hypothetical protein
MGNTESGRLQRAFSGANFLSKPLTEVESDSGEGNGFRFGWAHMQVGVWGVASEECEHVLDLIHACQGVSVSVFVLVLPLTDTHLLQHRAGERTWRTLTRPS